MDAEGMGMRRKVVLAALLLGTSGLIAGCDQVKQAVGGKTVEVKETEFPEKCCGGIPICILRTLLMPSDSVSAFHQRMPCALPAVRK